MSKVFWSVFNEVFVKLSDTQVQENPHCLALFSPFFPVTIPFSMKQLSTLKNVSHNDSGRQLLYQKSDFTAAHLPSCHGDRKLGSTRWDGPAGEQRGHIALQQRSSASCLKPTLTVRTIKLGINDGIKADQWPFRWKISKTPHAPYYLCLQVSPAAPVAVRLRSQVAVVSANSLRDSRY